MKNKITPIIRYTNLIECKSSILKETKDKSGIYRFKHKKTGKSYIGSSVNIGNRLSIYYSKKAMLNKTRDGISVIYSAFLKHGHLNFSLDILEYCDINVLTEREQHYMDYLKPEYNILKAANSRIGSKHTIRTKAIMSTKLKGINNPLFGKFHSYETRKKIGLSLKSVVRVNTVPRTVTMDTRLKLSSRSHGVSVIIFDASKTITKEFTTITSTARYLGISNRTVTRYLNKNKSYNGYSLISKIKD